MREAAVSNPHESQRAAYERFIDGFGGRVAAGIPSEQVKTQKRGGGIKHMRKISILFLCLILFAMPAMAEETEGFVFLPNPWEDTTAEDLYAISHLSFGVPEGAENVVYRYLKRSGLAEMQFYQGDDEYCARIQPVTEPTDISGMYFDWDNKEEVRIGKCTGTIGQAKTGSEDWIELCQWYDDDQGLQYSLSVYTTDIDGLDLTAIASQICQSGADDSLSETETEGDEEPAESVELLSDYWAEGSEAAQKINDYLLTVTDETSSDYIPEEDRIAVFDLDGTLMCETYPFCFEYMLFADYALNSGSDTITDEIRAVAQEIMDAAGKEKPEGMSTRQADAGAKAYKGMTMDELTGIVDSFKNSEAWGFEGMTRGEAFYRPMVELFEKLLANDFTVYVVTATERNIVREVIDGVLDIPASQVIGTEYGYMATGQGEEKDTDYTFQPSDRVVFDGSYVGENAKMSKVDAIVREIGKQPVLAFGNSSGDLAMEIYTISDNPYKSAAYMVLADDEKREYGDAEGAAEKKASYEDQGIGIISMKDDFKTIYGEDVMKSERRIAK